MFRAMGAEQTSMEFRTLVDIDDIRAAVERDVLARAGAALPELTHQQQLFVAEYMIDLNATKAAVRAGYSARTAAQIGSRLLSNVEVSRQINALLTRRLRAAQLTGDAVLQELRKIAFSDVRALYAADGELLPVGKLPDEIAACISSIEVDELTLGAGDKKRVIGSSKKVRLHPKLEALKMLAQHFKLLGETRPHGAEIEGEVVPMDEGMSPEEMRAAVVKLMQAGLGRIG
jgi:phage terminase small subunit